MNKTNPTSALCKSALLALGVALSLVLVPTVNLSATEATAAKSLPLTHSFAKVEGEDGPHTMKLTNTSSDALKVNVKILLSVYSHASDRAKVLPEETIAAGKDWTITKLAALDKVIISAEGYAPIELVVH